VSTEPIRVVTSVAAVLDRPNIDTDVIIRIERMVSTDLAILSTWAFEALRYQPDGSKNPDFVLNRPPFGRAQILVTGSNFGCGSSREPAVWAIKGLGIRVIIAPSFGDIFRANCYQNGLLPIVLAEEEVNELAALAATGPPITVDLEARQIRAEERQWTFAIGETQRLSLLEGLDDLDLALRDLDQIRSWERDDRATRS
jgi:3-isopropylmalate/(R)-2-methylmalate dehydratase small subunit